MFGWFRRKKLEDIVNETRKVKLAGIVFVIRKIDLIDYLAGQRVLVQTFDTHKTAGAKAAEAQAVVSNEKIRRHYADVLVAGVVDPVLVHKVDKEKGKDGILVDDVLRNWELVESLYMEIMAFTYGKKKLKQAMLLAKNSSNSTN